MLITLTRRDSMKNLIVSFVIITLMGCAGTGDSTRQDIRAQENYERVARQCAVEHGTIVVKRTGTRVRKPIEREALLTAQCR
jgi:hypothetical protein